MCKWHNDCLVLVSVKKLLQNLFNTTYNDYNSQGSMYYSREDGLSCISNTFSNYSALNNG